MSDMAKIVVTVTQQEVYNLYQYIYILKVVLVCFAYFLRMLYKLQDYYKQVLYTSVHVNSYA